MKDAMNVSASVMIAIVISITSSAQDDISDRELARQLANGSTRQVAIATLVATGSAKLPVLLSWTRTPPVEVDKTQLYIGLADVFKQLRTKEAIPFLIRNISLQRWLETNTWLKTAEVIEERLPAVGALVRIGPEASKALIRASWEPMTAEDRLAAIFVIARIRDPAARDFLRSAIAQANAERSWAEDGLKQLEGRR